MQVFELLGFVKYGFKIVARTVDDERKIEELEKFLAGYWKMHGRLPSFIGDDPLNEKTFVVVATEAMHNHFFVEGFLDFFKDQCKSEMIGNLFDQWDYDAGYTAAWTRREAIKEGYLS